MQDIADILSLHLYNSFFLIMYYFHHYLLLTSFQLFNFFVCFPVEFSTLPFEIASNKKVVSFSRCLFVCLNVWSFVSMFVRLSLCLFVCLYVCSFVCSGLSDSKSDFYGDMHERAIETKTLGLDSRYKQKLESQSIESQKFETRNRKIVWIRHQRWIRCTTRRHDCAWWLILL